MSRVVLDGGDHLVSHLLNFPADSVEKLLLSSRPHEATAAGEGKGAAGIPADILETPKEYVFYFDVPGLPKSDIQVLFVAYPLFLLGQIPRMFCPLPPSSTQLLLF